MRGAWDQMRQATTAKVRLDAGKSACFRASARPTGRFDCLPRTLRAIYRCRRRRRGRSWLQTIGNPGMIAAEMANG
jgi:wyosine [tRNA(Phe)-imidazoG37] synthetase (radical SAM superfamily)